LIFSGCLRDAGGNSINIIRFGGRRIPKKLGFSHDWGKIKKTKPMRRKSKDFASLSPQHGGIGENIQGKTSITSIWAATCYRKEKSIKKKYLSTVHREFWNRRDQNLNIKLRRLFGVKPLKNSEMRNGKVVTRKSKGKKTKFLRGGRRDSVKIKTKSSMWPVRYRIL